MKYYVETSLENFEAWSGGRDTLEVLIEKGLCDTVEACLEEILDGDTSDTYINDLLWFERDMIAEWCGFSSWEALENGEEEEEEETEEEEEAEDNNFSRWCANQSRDCSGCPYQRLFGCEMAYYHMGDCEAAYYHDQPEDDDGIRIYQ